MTSTERLARLIPIVASVPAFLAAATVALLTLGLAIQRASEAARDLFEGDLTTTILKTEFLGLVSLTLTSVVFYLIAVGMISLFIAPSFHVRGLKVKSLVDLEVKVLNVIVVVLATTFLERFIDSKDYGELLRLAGAMAIVVVAIIAFQVLLLRDVETKGADDSTGDHAH